MANTKQTSPKMMKKSQYENLLSYCNVDDIKRVDRGKTANPSSATIPCFACGEEVTVIGLQDKVELKHNNPSCSTKMMLNEIGWTANDLIERPGRPAIQVDNQTSGDLPHMVKKTFNGLLATNKPPSLFQFQAQMLRVRSLDGKPIIEILDDDKLEFELSQRVNFFKVVKENRITVLPLKYVIRGLRSSPDNPLPRLERIIECPTFTKNGTLHKIRGYSPHSNCYYIPSGNLE